MASPLLNSVEAECRIVSYGSHRCLYYQGQLLMTDDQWTRESQQFAVDGCWGKVLTAGLGLGCFAREMDDSPEVTSLAVVERLDEVVALIWPSLELSAKSQCITFDINNYLYTCRDGDYDCVYLDIWPDDSYKRYYQVVLPLRQLVEKVMPSAEVFCWQEDKMKNELKMKAKSP